MAYLQSDLPPAAAPAKAVTLSLVARGIPSRRSVGPRGRILPFLGAMLAILFFLVLGYLAAQATESLAIGVLAADLAFLVVVAGWSSVAGGDRRR
ncbi:MULTISPECIES: hypothetical protein [unclassified Sphingomonas]|uniref:hypothetical protein n=1 Tax=unclassified Sphingomonas TaxID=196159 RepID=UPI0006FD4424|nr:MULTISPECIES: hypothetical protein [unclassified Sphingomonas]KQX18799.1 hypothetical protein ASD17_15470 [Sphingomonas sp. Root1294]KQY72381.1 hypothetical protein ASD39_19505 [Sphingomonas sp. Root50]KRB95481.1 hypothetical protein ASE22_01245 [Sphingomonas sp. Root720]